MAIIESANSEITRRQICTMGLRALILMAAGHFASTGCSNQANMPQARLLATRETAGPPLRILAERAGIKIGAAVAPECLDETAYAETLGREFNQLVPENQLKWEHVHPTEDGYNFAPADRIVAFAESHGIQVRGHALVWHNQVPPWLTARRWGRRELIAILEDHIDTVVSHYAGRIQCWDVVNEVIDDCWLGFLGCGLRPTFWREMIGDDYITRAFTLAHTADPGAKLFINDYSAEEINAKSNALYALVRDLKMRGVPIDGVGFQLHLRQAQGFDFDSFEQNLQRFIALGVEIHFTEVDVAIAGEVNQEKLEQQAVIYQRLMMIARRYPQVTAFLTWGVTDKYSWLPWFAREVMHSTQPYGCGLLFDEQYRPKPAYFALREALQNPV